jgi:hypothetical protein
MDIGQALSSTSCEPKFVAQYNSLKFKPQIEYFKYSAQEYMRNTNTAERSKFQRSSFVIAFKNLIIEENLADLAYAEKLKLCLTRNSINKEL